MPTRWTEQERDVLIKYFPLVGSGPCARLLGRSSRSVSKYAASRGLKQVQPKEARLCTACFRNNQLSEGSDMTASRSTQCRECFSKRTATLRRNRGPRSLKSYLNDRLRSRITKLKTKQSYLKVTITLADLVEIYNNQDGKCYYSGLPMETGVYGEGRSPYRITLDQRTPKAGYTKENVVLCCWLANAGKDESSEETYVKFCEAVVNHHK